MKYSPYTPEWNRKRYLSEAIETYFKEGVEPKDIVGDILDVCLLYTSDAADE